jgi:hypothetical protein
MSTSRNSGTSRLGQGTEPRETPRCSTVEVPLGTRVFYHDVDACNCGFRIPVVLWVSISVRRRVYAPRASRDVRAIQQNRGWCRCPRPLPVTCPAQTVQDRAHPDASTRRKSFSCDRPMSVLRRVRTSRSMSSAGGGLSESLQTHSAERPPIVPSICHQRRHGLPARH